jgi:hypothetical protein
MQSIKMLRPNDPPARDSAIVLLHGRSRLSTQALEGNRVGPWTEAKVESRAGGSLGLIDAVDSPVGFGCHHDSLPMYQTRALRRYRRFPIMRNGPSLFSEKMEAIAVEA